MPVTIAERNPESRQGRKSTALTEGKEPLGGAIILLLIYLFLEYVRPPNPLGLPLLISLVLFFWWISQKDKVWAPQVICLYLLVASIAVMGPFAVNNFAVWIGFQSMVAWLLCISIPLMSFANSLRKVEVLVNALILLHCYLAFHAISHGGVGPGGFVGDENDVSLAINTMMPLAFCSFLGARTTRARVLYVLAVVIMVAGVISTNSRGGFLGLVAAMAACIFFSPRRGLGFAIAALLVLVALAFIPDSYWAEMGTIANEAQGAEGTGSHRKRLWGVAVNMFLANPVFGIGLNNFPFNAGDYMSAELMQLEGRSYSGTVAHSVYFTVLSETGIVGSILMLLLVYYSIKSVRHILRLTKAEEVSVDLNTKTRGDYLKIRGLAYGLAGGMIGYGVSGVFLTAFVYPHFWYVLALIVALENVTRNISKQNRKIQKPDQTKTLQLAERSKHRRGTRTRVRKALG